jgi:glycosyltransferase involved in cell wall biosynthesis
MDTPLVSVGIPFFNCEDSLPDSIRSIFAQTFQDWELLLVDDGSTDKSLQIAYAIDDPRVKVISDGKNKKLAARLNQIIDLARGKYIARMDADDLCSPKRIEKQLELFQKDPELDVVGTGMVFLDLDDIPLGDSFAPASHAEICSKPARTFGLCHPSIMAKKSWYEKNRYDETLPLSQDYELWLRSYRKSKFANVPEPLCYYRACYSFSLEKQFKDRNVIAGIILKYYKKQSRLDKALFYSLMQYIKIVAEVGLCITGLKNRLLSLRYNPLNSVDKELYMSEIQKIKNISLPVISA